MTKLLGTTYQYQKSGAKRRLVEKEETFQYVPLIDNLKWLLQNKGIYNEVCCCNSHTCNSQSMAGSAPSDLSL